MDGYIGIRPLTDGQSEETGYGIFYRNAYIMDGRLTVTRG
jgi:hypothetical protein